MRHSHILLLLLTAHAAPLQVRNRAQRRGAPASHARRGAAVVPHEAITASSSRRLATVCDYNSDVIDLDAGFLQYLPCASDFWPSLDSTVHSTRVDNPSGDTLSLFHAEGDSCSLSPGDAGFTATASVTSSTAPTISLFNTPCRGDPCCTIISCDNPTVACDPVVTTAFADSQPPPFCGYSFETGTPALTASTYAVFVSTPGCLADGFEQNVQITNPNADVITVVLTSGVTCAAGSGLNFETGTYPYEDRVLSTSETDVAFIASPCNDGEDCCAIVWCDAVNDAEGCVGLSVTQDFMPYLCGDIDEQISPIAENFIEVFSCNAEGSFDGHSTRVINPSRYVWAVYHTRGDFCSMLTTNPDFAFDANVTSSDAVIPLGIDTCESLTPCCVIVECMSPGGCNDDTRIFHDYSNDFADPPVTEWGPDGDECDITNAEASVAISSFNPQTSDSFGCLRAPLDTTISVSVGSIVGDSISAAITTGDTCLSGVDVETGTYPFIERVINSRSFIEFNNVSCASRTDASENCCVIVGCDAINGVGGCMFMSLNTIYSPEEPAAVPSSVPPPPSSTPVPPPPSPTSASPPLPSSASRVASPSRPPAATTATSTATARATTTTTTTPAAKSNGNSSAASPLDVGAIVGGVVGGVLGLGAIGVAVFFCCCRKSSSASGRAKGAPSLPSPASFSKGGDSVMASNNPLSLSATAGPHSGSGGGEWVAKAQMPVPPSQRALSMPRSSPHARPPPLASAADIYASISVPQLQTRTGAAAAAVDYERVTSVGVPLRPVPRNAPQAGQSV